MDIQKVQHVRLEVSDLMTNNFSQIMRLPMAKLEQRFAYCIPEGSAVLCISSAKNDTYCRVRSQKRVLGRHRTLDWTDKHSVTALMNHHSVHISSWGASYLGPVEARGDVRLGTGWKGEP